MSEIVQRLWYENVLLSMDREIDAAKILQRSISEADVCNSVELLRASIISFGERKKIAEGLETILQKIPNVEETLNIKMSLKTLQYEFNKRRRRKRLSGRSGCESYATV